MMPLKQSTSRKAFSENVAAERRAGRPEAQSVAIAYSEKRKAAAKKGALSAKARIFAGANR